MYEQNVAFSLVVFCLHAAFSHRFFTVFTTRRGVLVEFPLFIGNLVGVYLKKEVKCVKTMIRSNY